MTELSPEEKLLKYIKSKSVPAPAAGNDEIQKPMKNKNNETKPVFQTEVTISFDKFTVLNRILTIAICVLIVFFVFQSGFHWWQLHRFNHTMETRKSPLPGDEEKPVLPFDLQQLEKSFQSRELFKIFFVTKKIEKTSVQKKSIQDIIRNYHLAGIVMGDHPVAIIFDRKTRQNTYVHEGDIFNGLEIVRVSGNSVTLRYNDEEIDLNL